MLLLVLISTINHCTAQTTPGGLYKNHFHYGVTLHTHGYGASVRSLKTINYYKRRILDFDFSFTMKHPREQIVLGNSPGSNLYLFGKQNHVSILRFGYGRHRIIADFEQPMGIRIGVNYMTGPSLAMAKPIYLRVYTGNSDLPVVKKFDPVKYQDPSLIYGSGPWYYGIGESSFYPGISSKLGLSFEWGKLKDIYKMVEIGILLDIYPTKIPIMAYAENKSYFANIYISYSPRGKRW